ncbi:MAG: hypothetical protein KDD55_07720, partial [Bdellovibrionales bacterium]|nr:hypothetical protein [Bdellovibrionales bacterium]
SSLTLADLRKQVSNAVQKPLPLSGEEAAEVLPRTVETLQFLCEEPVSSKDSWDCMIDCAQMHDALTRASHLLSVLKSEEGPIPPDTVTSLQTVTNEHLAFYEDYFREKKGVEIVASQFASLSSSLAKFFPRPVD